MNDASQQKAGITSLFDELAAGYDAPALRFFPFCADRLVAYVQPAPGQKVLDVATGTGAVAVAMAQAVGPEGRVHAIDLSEAMMTRAEANVRKMALGNVDFHVMDAERLDFKNDYFHAAVCSFGLFFLPDMNAALRDWVRVTRPAGRVLFTSFGSQAFQPLMDRFAEQVVAFGGQLPSAQQGVRFATERLKSPEHCATLLREAGLEAVEVDKLQLGYHLASADDWWEVVWNSGFRALLNSIPPERREAFKAAHLQAVAELATEQGIWLDVEVRVARGRKPAG
jgi:ubiquinone/menaquinone biosynthesis C-methylase UbiE